MEATVNVTTPPFTLPDFDTLVIQLLALVPAPVIAALPTPPNAAGV